MFFSEAKNAKYESCDLVASLRNLLHATVLFRLCGVAAILPQNARAAPCIAGLEVVQLSGVS